ncbi:TBC1 domain family member 30 isoform X2 [Syngnathoides biaculeatus]|uniref:TBC1 domain family member 30 isoform X2 n=1 Tax=Syngnathoides biaculeatus TaxID=300417 RepID=UPI002ADD4F63|nr:TBC1 domain family member 30 isoform X2 [Syngnathoides biaculeatus]
MASEVQFSGGQLLELDICRDLLSSEAPSQDDFSSFQGWPSGPAASPSPPPPPPLVPPPPDDSDPDAATPRTSIVDCLLVELYDTYSGKRNVDSWDSSTEASGPDAFQGRCNAGSGFLQELQEKHTRRHQVNYLARKEPEELRTIIQEVKYRTGVQSAKLIRQLRRRDRLVYKLQKNYDIVTACLQAVSLKRRVDTRLKFTIEPSVGKNGFQQWYDALKAVARLPTGIPKEWRKRVWLTLADQYLHSISIDWDKTLRFAFNERSNPDDDSLGVQIVKDLHRTGCSSYGGHEGEQDRVVLKRVLLAYARWNKAVGYCQGFNVLAALILVVTQGDESDALKVMIYLIDKVLPESYFANNLRALSVDMAVFRDLLRVKLPRLSQHLHYLQRAANKEAGGSYEPPLTNVFTMQWFLTMFATCLPAPTVLKIWDSVFFEGSEVLFRVALVIWERLGERISYCQTADDFYSTMGRLTGEMLDRNLVDPPELIQEVYGMAAFPFPQLAELREKYTYNITPFPTSVKPSGSGWESDDEADDDDDDAAAAVSALGCLGPLGGLLAPEIQRYHKHLKDKCPATRVLASQLNPSSTVINHLLLGRKPRGASRPSGGTPPPARPVTSSPTRGSPGGRRRGSRPSDGGAASPWRAHMRAHRRNVARARLGFGDSEDMDEENGKTEDRVGDGAAEGCADPVHEKVPAEMEEVSVRLGTVDLEDDPPPKQISDARRVLRPSAVAEEDSSTSKGDDGDFPAVTPPRADSRIPFSSLSQSPSPVSTLTSVEPSSSPTPPSTPPALLPGFYKTSSPSTPSLSSVGSSSRAFTPAPQLSLVPKPQVFSPFPCVKLPRKSSAARNLGLYGPTSRTPAVCFPQLSRNCSGAAGTTRRR